MCIEKVSIKPVEKFLRKSSSDPYTRNFLRGVNFVIKKSWISFHQLHGEQINLCILMFSNDLRTKKRSPYIDLPDVQQGTDPVMKRLLSKPKTVKTSFF